MTPSIDLLERQKLIAARINEGRDTYAGRQDAWHMLGEVSGQFQTWKEMLAAAKAAFPVVKQQLDLSGTPVDAWGTFRLDETIPKGLETKAIPFTLPDGRKVFMTFLGTVGKDYQVIQHTQGFEILDHLVGSIDGAHYETMGTLDFGRTVWGQVDPAISIKIGEDEQKVLLSFHTSHDGSRRFDVYETFIRMVCRNTLKAGSLRRLAASLSVRHTKNADARIKDLKAEIDEIQHVALSMQDRLTWLSQKRVTRESFESIMERLFPKKKTHDGVEVEDSARRKNTLASIMALYEDNDGNQFPEQRGSAYNLLNAITNHTDHERSSKGNGRAESAVFGSGATLKENALDAILREAEGMPTLLSARQSIPVDFAAIGLNVKVN